MTKISTFIIAQKGRTVEIYMRKTHLVKLWVFSSLKGFVKWLLLEISRNQGDGNEQRVGDKLLNLFLHGMANVKLSYGKNNTALKLLDKVWIIVCVKCLKQLFRFDYHGSTKLMNSDPSLKVAGGINSLVYVCQYKLTFNATVNNMSVRRKIYICPT